MKLHTLPYVLGTDIVQISRFRRPDASWLRKLSGRILTNNEFAQLSHRYKVWYEFLLTKPGDAQESNITAVKKLDPAFFAWLAGRWAAKEAARKAWGASIIGFKDVGVIYDGQKPVIRCLPFRQQVSTVDQSLIQYGCLSLSHDGDYAIATVIAEPLAPELEKLFLARAAEVKATRNDPSSLMSERPGLPGDSKVQNPRHSTP